MCFWDFRYSKCIFGISLILQMYFRDFFDTLSDRQDNVKIHSKLPPPILEAQWASKLSITYNFLSGLLLWEASNTTFVLNFLKKHKKIVVSVISSFI